MSHRETGTQRESNRRRTGVRQRLLASAVAALLLILLVGLISPPCAPKPEPIFSGREGPLRLLPELAIDDGDASRHQEAGSTKPPPTPNAAPPIAPTPERSPVRVPPPAAVPVKPTAPATASTLAGSAVTLTLPTQTNPCFRLIHQVYPEYPPVPGVTAASVRVKVAFFVAPAGTVSAAYVLSCDGPPAFGAAAMAAVRQWRYAPVPEQCAGTAGFWQPLLIVFRRSTPQSLAPPAR